MTADGALLDRRPSASFPAASASALPSAAPSCATPRCSCSTSRSPISTPRSHGYAHGDRKLHQVLKATMIYVTHDQVEAMTLADKIVVLKDGQVMQVGSPMELYHKPANLFVAGFLWAPLDELS
jgi:hypothetical protein